MPTASTASSWRRTSAGIPACPSRNATAPARASAAMALTAKTHRERGLPAGGPSTGGLVIAPKIAARYPPRGPVPLLRGFVPGGSLHRGRGRLGALRDGPLERRPVAAVGRDLAAERLVAVGVERGLLRRVRLADGRVLGAQLLEPVLLGRESDPQRIRKLVVVHGHDAEASLQLADLHFGPGQLKINRSRHSIPLTGNRTDERGINTQTSNNRTGLEVMPATWRRLVQADGVPELLEEALAHLLRPAGQPPDLPEQRLLVGVEVLRHDHLDHHVLVAPTAAADVGHALAGQAEGLAVLGAGRDFDLDRALERGHLDPVADGRLDDVHVQLEDHVLLAPLELRVGLDPEDDVEVARRAAAHARLALGGEPDLGAGIDAGRDPDRQLPGLLHPALAAALGARALDHPPGARARGAGRRRHDRAEDRLLRAPHLARSAAGRAGVDARPGLRA